MTTSSLGCANPRCPNLAKPGQNHCQSCLNEQTWEKPAPVASAMAANYPKYYKDVSAYLDVDVYAVHKIFGIDDPSGAIQHASKKLLLSGTRTGGKTKFNDIKEARDTLTRWLELHPEG